MMTMPRLTRAFLLALLSLSTHAMAGTMQVQVAGAVARPGMLTLKAGARLSDAAIAAQPSPQAYLLGAAWLRPNLVESQQRLKAGVLFDLSRVQQRASAHDKHELGATTAALAEWIKTLPVTGRQTAALLAPRAVEIDEVENHLLADDDRLYYPWRPATIRVVGAVKHACTLPLVPLQNPRLYLASCATTRAADRDTIYVIEPDGRVFVQGIALWNRSNAPLPAAPGAIIYVPLRASMANAVDPTLNHDLATFLATQLLPGPGVE